MLSSPRRRVAVVTALVSVLVALTAVTAQPALAHAALLATTPGDGEIVPAPPSEVTLTFGEPVGVGLGSVRVLTAEGARVDSGPVRRSDDDRVVHVSLRPRVADGTYLVAWRVVSADSHPVSGTFTFSVGAPSTASGYRGRITTPSRVPSLTLAATRGIGYGALLLLLGGALFCALLWRDAARVAPVRRLLRAAAAAELAAAALALVVQGPYAAGLPITSVADGALLQEVLGTRYGVAVAVRVGVSAIAVALTLALPRGGRRSPLALAVAGVADAATWTAAGHGGTGELQPLTALLDCAHVVSVAAWVGGLVLLSLGLRGGWSEQTSARVLPRWSTVATVAVAGMVGTGLFASWRNVRTLDAVVTPYGGLLALKTFLVLLMLIAGANGRAYVRRHYSGRPPRSAETAPDGAVDVVVAGAATATATGTPRPVMSQPAPPVAAERLAPTAAHVAALRAGVRRETALAAAVIAVTAVLVQNPPAATAFAPPYTGTSVAGPYTVQVDLYPARKGVNGLHVYTLRNGRTEDVAAITGTLSRRDGESISVHPPRKSLGHYEDLHVVIPAKGTWQLDLRVRAGDVDSYPTQQTIRVS